jgi:hypothetical protein
MLYRLTSGRAGNTAKIALEGLKRTKSYIFVGFPPKNSGKVKVMMKNEYNSGREKEKFCLVCPYLWFSFDF